jgi:stage II sporulation protein M
MSDQGTSGAVLFTTVVFAVSLMIGIIATLRDPLIGQTFLDIFRDSVMGGIAGDSRSLIFVKIFLNNLQACLFLFLGGASLGAVTLFILSTNGLIIGSIIEIVREKQGLDFIFAAILPHGIFEIPSFILSGALGFMLAKALLDEWNGKADAASAAAHYGRFFVKFVFPLILIAAFVEAFITPEIISLVH